MLYSDLVHFLLLFISFEGSVVNINNTEYMLCIQFVDMEDFYLYDIF